MTCKLYYCGEIVFLDKMRTRNENKSHKYIHYHVDITFIFKVIIIFSCVRGGASACVWGISND